MMRDRKIGSMLAALLVSAALLSACGKINLPTLLVMDPSTSNTLSIKLPAVIGGGTVTSNLVGNMNTTVTIDTNKLLSAQGVPATVTVNSFATAGTSVKVAGFDTGTMCTYIPAGETAGGVAFLRPFIFQDATFQLTIPTETMGLKLRDSLAPIPLILNVDAKSKIDLMGLINLMLKGTGLSIHQVITMTIPDTVDLLGGSTVTLDSVLTSTKTPVTSPLLDECKAALATP